LTAKRGRKTLTSPSPLFLTVAWNMSSAVVSPRCRRSENRTRLSSQELVGVAKDMISSASRESSQEVVQLLFFFPFFYMSTGWCEGSVLCFERVRSSFFPPHRDLKKIEHSSPFPPGRFKGRVAALFFELSFSSLSDAEGFSPFQ